jgi:hypothetical protein
LPVPPGILARAFQSTRVTTRTLSVSRARLISTRSAIMVGDRLWSACPYTNTVQVGAPGAPAGPAGASEGGPSVCRAMPPSRGPPVPPAGGGGGGGGAVTVVPIIDIGPASPPGVAAAPGSRRHSIERQTRPGSQAPLGVQSQPSVAIRQAGLSFPQAADASSRAARTGGASR